MTNQLTQAELNDFANSAGFSVAGSDATGFVISYGESHCDLTSSLAKFAQLIQQPTSQESRQVEQGLDELVEALETIAASHYAIKEQS